MAIKIKEEAVEQSETRYTDEVYVDATKEAGGTVKVLDVRQTRTVTNLNLKKIEICIKLKQI